MNHKTVQDSFNSLRARFSVGKFVRTAAGIYVVGGMVGCSGRAELLPNSDPNLRHTSTEFAVDAAKRFPFKADAPSGGNAAARAQVGYMLKKLEIVNLSPDDWSNVEIWVNQKYVVGIAKMENHKLEALPFQMLFNDQGHSFPTDNTKEADTLINKVQIYNDGKMYDVPLQLAD